MDATSISQQKEALRRSVMKLRDAIDPVERLGLSETIHGVLDDVPAFRDAASVALYWAGGSEVSTTGLALRLAELEQRRIFLPFVLNGELALTEWRTQDPVVDAEYGHMHPRYRRAVALDEVDVIVVPGLAFDGRGARLGTGTGHYDRLLSRLDPRTIRIGLAFSSQVVAEVPTDDNDEPVHFVATEYGVSVGAPDASLTG